MEAHKPFAAGLFFYECIRLLMLAIFLLVAATEASFSGIYSVYMSSNALFPLMALFIWLRPKEHRNFTTLYTAGKIIALISFYAWEIFSFRRGISSGLVSRFGAVYQDFFLPENLAKNIILFGGGALLSLLDILSIWGVYLFNKKYNRELAPESGGV